MNFLLQKAVRQLIAAIGGMIAASGWTGGAHSLAGLTGGLVMWIGCALWSCLIKREIDDHWREVLRKLGDAVASQGVAFIAGWLNVHGFTGDPQSSEAVLIFSANLAWSQLTRPDSVAEEAPIRNPKSEIRNPKSEPPTTKLTR